MVNNIDKMIESLLEREDLRKELAEQETYDDVYDFCLGVQDGYTREELFGFLDSAQSDEHYDVAKNDEYDADIVSLDEELFARVGGGKGESLGQKALAAMKTYKDMKDGPTIFKPHDINAFSD